MTCLTLPHTNTTPLNHDNHSSVIQISHMGWLRLVGSIKLYVSFAKEPYKRDDILQKRLIILRSLLIVATPYPYSHHQNSQKFSSVISLYRISSNEQIFENFYLPPSWGQNSQKSICHLLSDFWYLISYV